jgi:PelA/Pel-15E family pectate lyase
MMLVTTLSINAQKKISDSAVRSTMMKATKFMVETVGYRGGYLWNYSPDFSRCWGELEAKPSMVWIENGTPAMGNTFLDAYQATKDPYYLEAAKAAANVLIWGQHYSGGWPYMLDFAGETSLKQWYDKVSKGYTYCAQEHAHYYGNCTFDDSATYDSAMFLLRMYMLTLDPEYKAAVEKSIDFVLDSQYPVGGWPQRYPLRYEYVKGGKEDYTSFITINDGVHTNNINFLLSCYVLLGESRLLEPIQRAMSCVLVLQGGKPQAGWAMQHKLDLNYSPGHARDFEPAGYAATATAEMCRNLMRFYRWTGDSKYLARIPDAFEFLESVKYSDEEIKALGKSVKEGQILCPTFAEVGTNRPLYLHRDAGRYWVDYDYHNLITHYSSTRVINLQALKDEYQQLTSMTKEEATKDSPFIGECDAYETMLSQLLQRKSAANADAAKVDSLMSILNKKDYLPGRLPGVSSENPGFSDAPLPKEVISIKEYMNGMATFVAYLNK